MTEERGPSHAIVVVVVVPEEGLVKLLYLVMDLRWWSISNLGVNEEK